MHIDRSLTIWAFLDVARSVLCIQSSFAIEGPQCPATEFKLITASTIWFVASNELFDRQMQLLMPEKESQKSVWAWVLSSLSLSLSFI